MQYTCSLARKIIGLYVVSFQKMEWINHVWFFKKKNVGPIFAHICYICYQYK